MAAATSNATFVSQVVPAGMVGGQTYSVSVTMKNTGTTTWTPATYKLGSQNPQDNTTWGTSRALLSPGASVAPNQTVTFTFSAMAPTTPGTYNFQWKMVQGTTWFGALTTNKAVPVSAPTNNNAQVISQTVPTTMVAGQTGVATVVMKNTGTTTWTGTGNYSLGSQNPQDNQAFGINRVPITYDVAPGQQFTFTLPMTAPPAPGTYNLQWQMVQDFVGWFGSQTTNVGVVVTAPSAGTLITVPPTQTGTNLPGRTAGKLSVTSGGQASYAVPIRVPPGSNGMAPSIGLQYVSGALNGPMGVGWALAGLSQITRCQRDWVHEGAPAAVDLSANDRFCIDGQRMILTGGATYGAASTQYNAEVHNFTKIVASSTVTGTGPTSFTATDRNGTKYEYGTVSTAQLLLTGSATPAAWALNKVTDARGNYYTITYTSSGTNTGQMLPSQIDYTGNANAALATYNSVKFVYDSTRTDVDWQYLAGFKIVKSLRLKEIQTYNGATLVEKFTLAYETSTPTARSRLASVTQCSGSTGPCLPPTTFTWENTALTTFGTGVTYPGDPTIEFGATFAQPGGAGTWNYGNSHWADLNGDGIVDHCRANEHETTPGSGTYDYEVLYCALSQPSGGPVIVNFGLKQFGVNANYDFVDVNGDGILDLCEARQGCQVMGPTGPTGAVFLSFLASAVDFTQFIDVNGDGLPDLCAVKKATGDLTCTVSGGGTYTSTVLGNFPVPSCALVGTCATPLYAWADLSGDGIPSFCRYDNSAGAMSCRKWTPTGLSPTAITTPAAASTFGQWVDVNGDGKADYCHSTSTGAVACTLSTGAGFGDTITSATGAPNQIWVDVNGDGKADVCGNTGANQSTCLLSTGSGFGATIVIPKSVLFSSDTSFGENTASGYVDANSDGKLDACDSSGCVTASGKASDYLQSVTDGLGAISAVDYGNLSDSTLYTKGTGAAFPVVDVRDTSFVVTEIHLPNGVDGTMETTYKYESLKNHLQGRGSFGFGAVTSTDPQAVSTRAESSQTFPFVGLPTRTIVSTSSATLHDSLQTYANTAGPAYTIQPGLNITQTNDLNGAFLNWVLTTPSNFDAYNNPQQVVVQYETATGQSDGFSSTSVIGYTNDTTNWILGLPNSVAETRVIPTNNSLKRTTTFSYFTANPGLGLVSQRIDEPTGALDVKLTTDYTYDAFGNLKTRAVSALGNITARTEVTNTYDTQGRFPTTVKNALLQAEGRQYDAKFGGITSLTDVNNQTTGWQYDEFGRVKIMTRPDGTQLTYDRKPCLNCVQFSAYATYITDTVTVGGATAAPYKRIYSDQLDRPVMVVHPSSTDVNTAVYEQLVYDAVGRLVKRSKPFYNSDSAIRWIQYTQFDALNRVTQVQVPDGDTGSAVSTTNTTYNGRFQTVTNNNNVNFEKEINSQGTVVSVTDAKGAAEESKITYVYDQWKNLTKATDSAGNVVQITYDVRGRKKQIVDPDSGTRTYTVDALGEVTSSVDAKSQTTTFVYDLLGRMTSRTEPDLVSNWYYEKDSSSAPCNNGVGKLCQVTASNAYSRRYAYDSKGRLSAMTTHIDADYMGSWFYDTAGRVSSFIFPLSNGTGPLALTYGYSTSGVLVSKTDTNAGTRYWLRNSENSDGNLTNEVFGNAYIASRGYKFNSGLLATMTAGTTTTPNSVQDMLYDYDSLGRMTLRKDSIVPATPTTDTFGYDNLNRLLTADLTAPGVGTQSGTFSYNALGNITSKSPGMTYTYATPGKPHAVSSVTGVVNGVTNPSYLYDANGNMSTDGTRSFTWTSFNMPLTISKTATSPSPGSGTATFNYGAEHQRVKQTWVSGATTTTVYLPEFDFEKVIDSTGSTYRHYIKADGRLVANVTRAPAGNTVNYVITDHLGSPSVLIDASGAVVDRLAYDPWGDRRFTNGAFDPTNTIQPTSTNRGYTGHEMLDQGNVGLVHMNGRVYDPTLARFISPDPNVPYPYSTQSFNRYSYVGNAPLDWIDPTGFTETDSLEHVEVTGKLEKPEDPDPPSPRGRTLWSFDAGGALVAHTVFERVEVGPPKVPGIPKPTTITVTAADLIALLRDAVRGFFIFTPSNASDHGHEERELRRIRQLERLRAQQALSANSQASEDDKAPDVKPDREQRPDDVPPGTVPVDQDKRLDREKIHGIKDQLGAGAKDWVGIDRDGNIWTNEGGSGMNNGPYQDYVNSGGGRGR